MYYLDIIIIVNGVMDAFLLGFTAHLLRRKIRWPGMLAAVIIGELPIIVILWDSPVLIALAKVLTPPAMVAVGLRTRSLAELAKGLLFFSLLAAVCGGIYYAAAGWFGIGADKAYLEMSDLWILPVMALLLTAGCKIWERLHKQNAFLDNVLYEAELFFGNDKQITVKALLDTGNELRDPLTGSPVMILEEQKVITLLPPVVQAFLHEPWRESADPWSYIWSNEDDALHKMVLISAKGIQGQTWLPGIRIEKVRIRQDGRCWEQPVTVALVRQSLNAEGRFEGLLHPEHIQKPVAKEEIA